jgi:hypothetical protein
VINKEYAMPSGTKNVQVTVTFPPGQNGPQFQLGGDVNGQGAVLIDSDTTDTINWNLNGNGPNGAVTFAATDPIQWVDSCGNKTSNPWQNGAPTLTRVSDTLVQTTDVNTTPHTGTLVHLYKINVVSGGNPYAYDPEVDEIGGGGR